MDTNKLFVCIESKNTQGQTIYCIYSVHLGDFTSCPSRKPKREVVIRSGVPDMGCGIFGSKIVLAGGLVETEKRPSKYKGVITYDMATKQVSDTDFPLMREGKVNPLLFQLNNKLFALDTSNNLRRRSFEIYFPKQKHWHQLRNHYCFFPPSYIDDLCLGNFHYSWFLFGKCLGICFPRDERAYHYHSQCLYRDFDSCFRDPLTFYGMATTYYQHGFQNLVVISFNKGRVEARLLHRNISFGPDMPKLIFQAEPSTQPDDISSYLVNFGDGLFCLTTFDKINIHVYTFKINRGPDKPDGSLVLNLLCKNITKYDLTRFSVKEHKNFRLVSCFAPLTNIDKKERLEANIYSHKFLLSRREEEDDDDKPLTSESPDELLYFSDATEPEDEPCDVSDSEIVYSP